MNQFFSKSSFIITCLIISFFIHQKVLASVSVGTILPSFTTTKICKDTTCTSFSNVNVKPTINTTTTGALPIVITDVSITGHAWGDQIGWINFSPTGLSSGDVLKVNPMTGIITGKAYANSGSWINFSPTYSGTGPQVGVTLVDNGSGSDFSGWAWVSGAHGGWMKFDCTGIGTCIKTDWRITAHRYACSDGIDNDGDGLVDFPTDPGCSSLVDTDETNTSGGGGGGGGGGGSSGGTVCPNPTILINGVCTDQTITPLITTTLQNPALNTDYTPAICEPYLLGYIKLGSKNNPREVRKLETFLNTYEQEKLEVNGIYEKNDFEAVKRFQKKNHETLSFWGITQPTGYVYLSTQKAINRIYCQKTMNIKCPYFGEYQKPGNNNDEVIKIKKFLNKTQGEKIPETQSYDKSLADAVRRFQEKYAFKALTPWGLKKSTGNWYQSTRKTAEDLLGCFAPVRLDNGIILE